MIQASIYGRLGRDPKPGTTQGGKAMCTASIAVDVGKDPGTETLWVSIMCFGPLAEALGKHQQGDMIAAVGKLTRGRYIWQDGQERESWSLLADALHSSRTVRPGQRNSERQGRATPPRTERHSESRRVDSWDASFDDPITF